MGQASLTHVQHPFQIPLNGCGIGVLIQVSAVGSPTFAFTDAAQQSLYTAHWSSLWPTSLKVATSANISPLPAGERARSLTPTRNALDRKSTRLNSSHVRIS